MVFPVVKHFRDHLAVKQYKVQVSLFFFNIGVFIDAAKFVLYLLNQLLPKM